MEETKELNLVQRVDRIDKVLDNPKIAKKIAREVKLPNKAKVKKAKLKKGWIGILKIDENKNISMEKQQIEDSTLRTKDGTYHSISGEEILKWNGKFPVIIQATTKISPYLSNLNQTIGQKYIMARMLKDAIKVKSKAGNFIIWVIVAIIVVIGISYLLKSGSLNKLIGGK